MNTPICILLVEDNPADARLIQEALLETASNHAAARPFKLILAHRLADGLNQLAHDDVDLILLDLSLADSHGLDTLLKFSAQAPTLPIIVMTGLDNEVVTRSALQAGAQDYLIKGEVDGNSLARAINYAIERKRAEEALRESERQLRLLNETLEQKVREQTAEVRKLASDLTKAENRERYRISHILHDDLQQRLYAIQMQMASLIPGLDADDTALRNELTEMKEQLDEVLTVVRYLSIDLSPPILHDEGLTQAIRWLAFQMKEQHGLQVEVQAQESFAIPDREMQVLLFNCVRELLFNVVKHAGVNQATVSLQRSNGDLQIEVRDKGKGFPNGVPALRDIKDLEGDLPVQRSFGLPTLRHRLSLFGGRMDIHSKPGDGTSIQLKIPLYEQSRGKGEPQEK